MNYLVPVFDPVNARVECNDDASFCSRMLHCAWGNRCLHAYGWRTLMNWGSRPRADYTKALELMKSKREG